MLVLSRKRDEKIIVRVEGYQDIIIQVVEISGDRVRLGCVATDDVTFLRNELLEEAIVR